MKNKKAFTLIELLVVIAIIAILAAILFPVFAQAKEAAKKTQTISNTKNMGTATLIYQGDVDDVFPLQASFDGATQRWRWDFLIRTPNGWTNAAPHNVEPRKTEDGSMWANSLYSYAKNFDVYSGAGLPDRTVVTAPAGSGKPAKVALSYNGLLHGYSGTAAASPATLPILYTANGKQNLVGFANSNPALKCDQVGTSCAYNPGRHPQTGAIGQGGTMFFLVGCAGTAADANGPSHKIHSDDAIYVYADGHVKAQKIGMQGSAAALSGGAPDTNPYVDPNNQYFPGGKCSQTYWWDGSHPWLFRPDYQP